MTANSDFGTDLSCVTDLTPQCTVVSGRRLLAEAIARRLITPRGRLIGDPDYGTDITDLINDDVDATTIGAMRSAIVAECLKDERVVSAEVTITAPPGGTGSYKIDISLEDGDGPFPLTLDVSEVTVELLTVD